MAEKLRTGVLMPVYHRQGDKVTVEGIAKLVSKVRVYKDGGEMWNVRFVNEDKTCLRRLHEDDQSATTAKAAAKKSPPRGLDDRQPRLF